MIIFSDGETLPPKHQGGVVALGNFDGVHKGHQVVLGEAGRIARANDVALGIVLMEPHPVSFFKPDIAPFRLTNRTARLDLISNFGVDWCAMLAFNASLSSLSAETFVRDILVARLGVKHIVVGADYGFGKGRGGNVALLHDMGEALGFEVHAIDLVPFTEEGSAPQSEDAEKGSALSSTAIRAQLKEGHVRRAAAMLGHWWTIAGEVVQGDQRGRTIGFPTANIALGDVIHPKLGVYAVRVRTASGAFEDGQSLHLGVANLGRRPTFDKTDILLEVHLFDIDLDLYGQTLLVEFVQFIRPEMKFGGLDELKAQIAHDEESARALLKAKENERSRFKRPTLASYLD